MNGDEIEAVVELRFGAGRGIGMVDLREASVGRLYLRLRCVSLHSQNVVKATALALAAGGSSPRRRLRRREGLDGGRRESDGGRRESDGGRGGRSRREKGRLRRDEEVGEI